MYVDFTVMVSQTLKLVWEYMSIQKRGVSMEIVTEPVTQIVIYYKTKNKTAMTIKPSRCLRGSQANKSADGMWTHARMLPPQSYVATCYYNAACGLSTSIISLSLSLTETRSIKPKPIPKPKPKPKPNPPEYITFFSAAAILGKRCRHCPHSLRSCQGYA